MIARAAILLLGIVLACPPALASEIYYRKESIAVFAGRFATGTLGPSSVPFGSLYEDNYVVAAAYSRNFAELGLGFFLDGEIGLAGRFGDSTSGEVWFGPRLRHRGISVGNVFTLSPSVTFGLSAVTSPIGIERARELASGGDATLLFYFGPEIALFFHSMPNVEFFYRVHHRSGALGTLGKMEEGSNAQVLGIRYWLPNGLFR